MISATQRIAGVGLALALGANLWADEPADLIDAHLAAVGGTEALANIKTLQRSGKAAVDSDFGQFEGTVREVFVVGKKAYTSSDYGAFAEERAWNGETAWAKNIQEGLKDLEGDDVEFLKMAAGADPIVAIQDQRGRAALEAKGEQEFDGETYHAIKVADADLTFFLDKETNLIAAMSTKGNDPALGGDYVVTVKYEQYKPVEGVQMPHKSIVDVAEGAFVIETTYEETTVNEPVDEELFEKPEQ
ncbi:MAG: hypothetical protein ACOC46_02895 [Pirellulales bacterium]